MGLLRWLAETLDTQVRVDRARMKELWAANDDLKHNEVKLADERDSYKRATENLAGRLADTALTINKLRADIRELRDLLIITRAYAMDSYDVELAALEALGPRSKQRPAHAATVEAIKGDLKQIADTLVATSDKKAGAA